VSSLLQERDRELLLDVLEHGQEALSYLKGVTYPEFKNDRKLRLITERLLEIIGEAAGHLSDEAKQMIPYDWRAVRGLRNILTHQYGSVDPATLYQAATTNLPQLLESIQLALADDE
jgi:uncharacterized protein with HEPN domain